MIQSRAYSKECHGGSTLQCAVGDFALLGQILGRFDGRCHALDGEEGGQIGRVGRDDDEREKPPDATHDAGGSRFGIQIGSLLHERADGEPETVAQRELIVHHR